MEEVVDTIWTALPQNSKIQHPKTYFRTFPKVAQTKFFWFYWLHESGQYFRRLFSLGYPIVLDDKKTTWQADDLRYEKERHEWWSFHFFSRQNLMILVCNSTSGAQMCFCSVSFSFLIDTKPFFPKLFCVIHILTDSSTSFRAVVFYVFYFNWLTFSFIKRMYPKRQGEQIQQTTAIKKIKTDMLTLIGNPKVNSREYSS